MSNAPAGPYTCSAVGPPSVADPLPSSCRLPPLSSRRWGNNVPLDDHEAERPCLRRAAIRRQNAPRARGERGRCFAASRNACATRLPPGRVARDFTRPPDFFGLGTRPSQRPQCCSLGHRRMSVPLSRTTTRAVLASIPSRAVQSPPATWCSRCRASKGPSFSWRRRTRRFGANGGTSGNAMPWRCASMPRSQARIGSW